MVTDRNELVELTCSLRICSDFGSLSNHLQRFDRYCLEMTISLRDVYLDDAKQVRREMDKTWRQYEKMWTQIIEEGQARNELSRCGSPKMIAFAILGMCNWLARWYDPKKSVSVDELIETYFQMLAHGLVPADRRRREHALNLSAKRQKLSSRAARDRAFETHMARARDLAH